MLDLLFGPRRQAAVSNADHGWITSRVRTTAGAVVDEDLALTYSALWCGTRVIAETAASLPLFLYRKLPDDGREQATDHPIYDLLKSAPNPDMGSMAFREGRLVHQVLWGNGFAEIERDINDTPIALWPIHPSRVPPVRPQDRVPPGYAYLVRNNDGTSMALKASEMLHVPGVLTEDGIWGKSVVAYARESIGFGIATERHGAIYFGSGAQPRGIVYGPGMKDPEQRRNFRSEWKQMHGSPDSGEIAILPIEAKYERITISNEDSQFLGTRAFNVNEIARWLRIPPHLLMDLERATFSNIEHQGLEFVTYGLLPWLRRWEEQIALKLLAPEERNEYYAEHQIAGLLRGDLQSRMSAYQVALTHGILTLNEVRRLENQNGIGEAGDKNYFPMNMTTAEALAAAPMPGAAEEVEPSADEMAEGDPGSELLDVPDTRQTLAYDCGAACVQAVAEFFGVDEGRDESQYVTELGTTTAGTDPKSMVEWFNTAGLIATSGPGMTVEDLAGFFAAGQPVLCAILIEGSISHWVVVIGVGLGQVFLQDPLAGRTLMAATEFEKAWGQDADHFGIAVGEMVVLGSAEPEPEEEPEVEPVGPEEELEVAEAEDESLSAIAHPPLTVALAEWACGGPGSGVPGPCPSGSKSGDRPSRPEGGFKSDAHIAEHGSSMVASHEADPHVQALTAKRDEAQAKMDEAHARMNAAVADPSSPAASLTQAMADRAAAEGQVKEATAALQHEARRSFLQSFTVPPGERAKLSGEDTGKAYANTRRENFSKVQDLVEQTSSKDAIGDQRVRTDAAKGGRANYIAGIVSTSRNDGPEITAHELGHHFEETASVRERTAEFSEKRFGNEQSKPMADVAPRHGYGKDEAGRKDDMEKLFGSDEEGKNQAYYAGKAYGNGRTEVMSMGLEQLYRDPVHFAKADPEYFSLVVGSLQGGKKK